MRLRSAAQLQSLCDWHRLGVQQCPHDSPDLAHGMAQSSPVPAHQHPKHLQAHKLGSDMSRDCRCLVRKIPRLEISCLLQYFQNWTKYYNYWNKLRSWLFDLTIMSLQCSLSIVVYSFDYWILTEHLTSNFVISKRAVEWFANDLLGSINLGAYY